MRALRGVMMGAALAGLCGCADPQMAQVEPKTYQISLLAWWPANTRDGAEAGLDYAALGACPLGYTKLDEHEAWGSLTWKIRCNVPRV